MRGRAHSDAQCLAETRIAASVPNQQMRIARQLQSAGALPHATTIVAPLQFATEPMPTVPPEREPEPEPRRRYAMVPQIAAVALIASSIAGFVLAGQGGSNSATTAAPTATPVRR